jgi:hypothetical protein
LQQQLRRVGGDPCAGQHLRVVVRDGAVAGPLPEEGYPLAQLLSDWRG